MRHVLTRDVVNGLADLDFHRSSAAGWEFGREASPDIWEFVYAFSERVDPGSPALRLHIGLAVGVVPQRPWLSEELRSAVRKSFSSVDANVQFALLPPEDFSIQHELMWLINTRDDAPAAASALSERLKLTLPVIDKLAEDGAGVVASTSELHLTHAAAPFARGGGTSRSIYV